MAETRTKNMVRNTITGMTFRVIGILLPFLVRTVIIHKLGNEYAGLSSLFSSILQVLSLSELGFSTAIAYSMFKPVAEGNKEKVCALLNLIKKIYRIIGTVILVAGIAVTPFLPSLVSGDVPPDINLYILYFIYLFNTVITYFMFAYTSSLLSALQRTDIENIVYIIANIIMYGCQILVLLLFNNYYIYIIFMPLCTIAINLLRYYRVKKLYPEYFCVGKVEKQERKKIFKNIGALAGYKLSNVVISSIGNIIISAYFGLTVLGIYGNYYYIFNALFMIVAIIYASITSTIGNSIVVDSLEKNYRDFKTLTFCNVWLIGWISICLACLYQHFIELWAGVDSLLSTDTAILLAVYFYLWKFKDIVSTYKDGAGMWRDDILRPYVVTIVTIILNFVLIHYIGINGTIIAGIVGTFVISMPWETHVFFKNYLKRKEWGYYLKMLIYTIIIFAIGLGTYFICSLLPSTGVIGLVLKALICLFVPNIIILLLSFKTPEFKIVFSKFMSLIKRKNKKTQN